MKPIAQAFLILLPLLGSIGMAQTTPTDCGSSVNPCTITAAIANGQITIPTAQQYVSVPLNTEIRWNVTGGVSYFVVALDFNPAGSIFGAKTEIFFKGGPSGYTGSKVVSASGGVAVHYFIYAVDAAGVKYVLDPKVIIKSGVPGAIKVAP